MRLKYIIIFIILEIIGIIFEGINDMSDFLAVTGCSIALTLGIWWGTNSDDDNA